MKSCGDWTDFTVTRSEANFDRASDEAYRYSINYFEIDEYGHSRRVKDWERCCCWIELEFLGYVRCGNDHHYRFRATAKRNQEASGDE